ncbi:MAG TPA: RNA ligase family protein [Planctomycetota bacterium]|nr:RNA ligase family protein [Planctomycetota bacterium]
MGASFGDFIKYPRTPHLTGSKGTDDDKHLSAEESAVFLADESLIVEEKIDGTNTGLHFSPDGKLILQCRGHIITEGMHPQYDLFKQWAMVKRDTLEIMLEDRYILFGEWLYARHSVHYRALTHYFFEFDIYDKKANAFLDLEARKALLCGSGIQTVPIVARGRKTFDELLKLIGPSAFGAEFENPRTGKSDDRMEGLYLRTEANGCVTGRAKIVRPEFVEKIQQGDHWKNQVMVPNLLIDTADLWS